MFSRLDLEEKIKEYFKIEEMTPLINHQIDKFIRTDGMDYKDIARALAYFCVIKGQSPEREMGIAIVPYIKDDATLYFDNLKKRIERQKKEVAERQKKAMPDNVIVCNSIKKKRKIKSSIDLSKIGEEE